MSRFRPRWLAAAVAAALVAVAAWAVPAAGDQVTSNQPAGSPTTTAAFQTTALQPADLKPLTITLITGDKVTLRRSPGGTASTEVRPGPGRAGMMFHKFALGNQQSVLPFDAIPLVTAGIVDARLFDVALLADLGLDDASAPQLPLLVQYAGQPRAVRQALPAGTEVNRELPIVDAVALGAASNGRYRGVAPEADLMIGKICSRRNCELSAIIAGMEWAANEGARVVNLSVGGGPSDGTDIVAKAVNELTETTGRLFVAAAGNFGSESSVGSTRPGAHRNSSRP
ncbi:subtilase family protein [Kribbella sp. VKM Ac-2527]|uniref:Subtilase family protein n=1 Tax=Kribbella caucasensis TaxID=2512215 RepID=A0A4R6KMM2_9ACTN|nr:S8 family serine peptidase [Kribbella sp. VKM Ac-2527]TDO52501.1 subtilase family protein [Kribbella sp. VKM Ac-2527]